MGKMQDQHTKFLFHSVQIIHAIRFCDMKLKKYKDKMPEIEKPKKRRK